ncbi:MAG TPA: hypothetical protein VKZ63_00315 [Kofleriaceae bacterium]|nr:hypothetical protein [Kofleriaceae bacterium]
MSEAFKKDVPADGDVAALGEIVTGAARMLVPLARMYLGPAAASVGQEGGDGRVLMLAFNKLLIEAGTLPAPGTEYEPHKTAFTIDERTGMGNAVDLPYLLGGLRALSMWASAPPPPPASRQGAALERSAEEVRASAGAPLSARELRAAARVRSYRAAAPEAALRPPPARPAPSLARPATRRGGCGCAGEPVAPPAPRRCGCFGTQSCADCIPRTAPAADPCACGTCAPRPPEACTPWVPSCEARNRLRECLRDILCELMTCVEQALCRNGSIDPAWRQNLERCLIELFCRLLRCVREALCPPPVDCTPELPAPIDCIPCSYAVEEPR